MLTADEDITTELDRVVCRLMKLALRTSKGRQTPPPTRWIQCKLLDLLTLTEKSIERRKRHFIESYPLRAIDYDIAAQDKSQEMIALEKIREDNTAKIIVDKYRHLVQPLDKSGITEEARPKYRYIDLELEDDLSVSSNEFLKDFEFIENRSPINELNVLNDTIHSLEVLSKKEETKLERTQAWVQEDVEVVPCLNHDINFDNSSGDTDHSTCNIAKFKYKKANKRRNKVIEKDSGSYQLCKRSLSKTSYGKQHKIKLHENNENKAKMSTVFIKKMARKKTSYNNFVKHSRNEYTATEYRNNCLTSKKKIKKNKHLHSKNAKPIPQSFIDLCPPKLVIDKSMEVFNDSATYPKNKDMITNENISNVAATEESLFVNIVMEDKEETIALRRTIGTDTDVDPVLFENETFIRSVSNTVQDDSCNCKHDVATENVQLQTIFLYDIDEPTTSKGIRHVSMDVQCGPDATVPIYSTLSPTTSLSNFHNIFKTGIKIGDSVTDFLVKSSDFGTSTNECNDSYKTITPSRKSVGVKIRDSVSNFCEKVECSTTTQGNLDTPTPALPIHNFTTETKLLKQVSSGLKLDDSGSEFCGSLGSLPKSPLHFENSSKNTSDSKVAASVSKGYGIVEKLSSIKYIRPKLCCGGVQVHSFRDKQESEDIIYQGEWQQYRPKAGKKVYNSIVAKKDFILKYKKVNSKEKIPIIKSAIKNEINTELKKSIGVRNTKLTNIKQEFSKKIDQNKSFTRPNSVIKMNRPIKTLTKVASKLTMNSISKNTKPAIIGKRSTLLAVTVKNDNEKLQKLQNYLPVYLRKNSFKSSINSNKKGLNQSVDCVETTIKVNKEKPKIMPSLASSKTEEIKRQLLKFNNEPRDISYVVFRNEVDNNISSASDGQPSVNIKESVKKKNSICTRPHSPQSPTSSTCSSPNSIATVRAVSLRPKNSTIRKTPVSTHKTNTPNTEPENTTQTKNKKFTKRCKSAKKTDEKNYDNKENVPAPSRTCNTVKKESDKFGKSAFMGRQKSVYIAQLNENPPLESTVNTLSKYKVQTNKSNVKIPSIRSTNEKRMPESPSVSKKISKSETSFLNDNNINQVSDASESSNMVLVLKQQQAQVQALENSTNIVSENQVNISAKIYLSESFDNANTNVDNGQSSNIIIAMRQLIEETLDFIDSPFDRCTIDSGTVILNRENINDPYLDLNSSPTSFKTVITKDNLDTSLESDIENALNLTFDTTLGIGSQMSFDDTRLTVTDFDLLSFKSVTTVSKYSEYFLADSGLSNSQDLSQHTPDTTSVRDLFERKDRHLIQNPAAALAIQAFSGFSINGEPVTGDQPDYVNLIDSETGSMAVEMNRQATSEELFISGRSSDSYESCLIDEDAVVPNWLFHVISQQQSVNEPDPPPSVPMPLPMPIVEPMFDANGNVMDGGLGVAAGAGDGRGMHSDQSQDSSGRGTSLSSSATSSGPQSEAILIDPSAFVAQFEQLQGAIGTAIVVALANPDEPPDILMISEGVENHPNELRFSHTTNPLNQQMTSDVDADVSSLDTDIPDSSDN